MKRQSNQPFNTFCNTPLDYADMANQESEFIYFTYLYQLALNMFKYTNNDDPEGVMPEWFDEFFLRFEQVNNGYVLAFIDENIGPVLTKCAIGGRLNMHNLPTSYFPVDPTGQLAETEVQAENAVLLKNSPLFIGMAPYLNYYAKQLSLCSRTIETNLEAQWTPYIITGDKRMLNSFKQFMNQVKKGVSTIFAAKSFDQNSISTLNTQAPFVGSNVNEMKQSIMRECMTVLGIDNANQDKKERVQAAEVNANNTQIIASRNIWMAEQKRGIKQLNKLMGTNFEVSFRAYDDLMDLLEINDQSLDMDLNGEAVIDDNE